MKEKKMISICNTYSKSEAAKRLGIGINTLNKLIIEGRIGIIQISKRERISEAELQRFIHANTFYLEKSDSTNNDEFDMNQLRNEIICDSKRKKEIINSKEIFKKIKENKYGISL
jgi:excisionase family DNA binding protein